MVITYHRHSGWEVYLQFECSFNYCSTLTDCASCLSDYLPQDSGEENTIWGYAMKTNIDEQRISGKGNIFRNCRNKHKL